MRYYIMSQDKRIKQPIRFREFSPNQVEEFDRSYAKKQRVSVTLHLLDDKHTVYSDVVEAPCYMVSKALSDIIQMFDVETIFPNVVFHSRVMDPLVYKILLTDREDVLHEDTEFYKDKSIKNLVLDRTKIGNKQVFRIDGISPGYVIVSMNIVEAVIRRGLEGIVFQQVEVR